MLGDLAAGRGALGYSKLTLSEFVDGVRGHDVAGRRGLFAPAMTRSLNNYIEAQIHGTVDLAADAEALVIDPAFADTPTAEALISTAGRHGLSIEWHQGTVLALWEVPRTAPQVVDRAPMRWEQLLGRGRAYRLARLVIQRHATTNSRLDAATIGQAATSVARTPATWAEWGTQPEVLVHLKDLWLMLVALGNPSR